ncbi:MAG TPA: ABC transporter substrate-binding protein [Symbiobacteriaceae bacterium]|jgi:NitT/TauT family transport system substrate-binding protein|nr:ABC transporter substrate-binding protein [Symbiobacteriaceae bacterium]
MKVSRFLSVMLMVALVAVGCGGSPSKAPESAPAAPSAQDQPKAQAPAKPADKVQIPIGGATSSLIYLPPVLAKALGYFAEENIDAEIVGMKSGAESAQALVSGQVDFAGLAVEHAVKSRAQGVDLVMVDLFVRYPGVTLIVDSKLKDKVKTVADLKGMKVGVTSPGSGTHKAMLSLMDKFGLNVNDVEIVGVGTSGMPAAIESGKVSAAVGLDPWVTEMLSSGKAFSLWDLRSKKDTEELYGGDYPFVGLMTRKEVIEKNPDLVARVTRAVTRANLFLANNSAETIVSKLPAEVRGDNEALYLASLRNTLEAYAPNGLATEKGLQIVIDSLIKDKVIPSDANIKPAMVFDASYASKVK